MFGLGGRDFMRAGLVVAKEGKVSRAGWVALCLTLWAKDLRHPVKGPEIYRDLAHATAWWRLFPGSPR